MLVICVAAFCLKCLCFREKTKSRVNGTSNNTDLRSNTGHVRWQWHNTFYGAALSVWPVICASWVQLLQGFQKGKFDIFVAWKLAKLRCVYNCKFHSWFCIKLARFVTNFYFITKRASLVQNHPRNCANVNNPLCMKLEQCSILFH
jgi:hypothetical protein